MAAIVRVWQNAKGGATASVTIDPLGRQATTFARQDHWCVQYDGMVQASAVIGAAGLPTVSTVPKEDGFICIGHQPTQDANSPYVWHVMVNYVANKQPEISGTPPVWSKSLTVSSVAREETVTEDRLGLPLSDTAGNLLDPLPNSDQYDKVFQIAWTQSAVPTWITQPIEGRTNNASVSLHIDGITATWTKSQAKVTAASVNVTRTTEVEGGSSVTKLAYNCNLTIQVRTPKWVWRTVNRGWRGYVIEAGAGEGGGDLALPITFRDTETHDKNADAPPSTDQVAMNADGTRRPKGSTYLILPDDLIGEAVPNGNRTYVADGAFELESQFNLGAIISPLNDS